MQNTGKQQTRRGQAVTCHRLAAVSLCQQSMELSALEISRAQAEYPVTAIAPIVTRRGLSWEERLQTYNRPLTATWLYRLEWIQEELVNNPKFDPVSKESWAKWKVEWGLLTRFAQLLYYEQASIGKQV